MVGNLRLERATRKYLEAHNIAPIDLAPLVKDLTRKHQHAAAAEIFINELRKAKPALRHEWKLAPGSQFPLHRAGADAYQRVHKDYPFAAELLKETIPFFKADRKNYPGWVVCPVQHRRSLHHAGGANWLLRKPVLDLLEPALRAEAVFEILWRCTTAFAPIDMQLAAALTELVDTRPPEVDVEMRLEFMLALMRDARVSFDDDGFKKWGPSSKRRPGLTSAVRQQAEYQWCLRARDHMDRATLAARLANLTSEDPVWKLRRAALHTETGEYVKATELIRDATADLERRHRLYRNSLSIKSQLGWACLVSRATAACSTQWDDLQEPRDFTALDIDPLGEIQYIERRAREIEKDRRDDAVAVRAAFEAGHYSDGSGKIRVGAGDPGILLLYEFDQLIEQFGLPLRINHVNICAGAAVAAVEVALQANVEWHVWLLLALHGHMDRPFERHFSRVAVARMTAATGSALISIVESAVTFWTRRMKEAPIPEFRDDLNCAVDVLRLSLVTLSRLTVRMSPDQAVGTLRRAVDRRTIPNYRTRG